MYEINALNNKDSYNQVDRVCNSMGAPSPATVRISLNQSNPESADDAVA